VQPKHPTKVTSKSDSSSLSKNPPSPKKAGKMSYSTEWSHDFCLACDKQTIEGVYCSQACRLADLETAGLQTSTISNPPSTSSSYSGHASHGFFLPPAFDFAAFRPSYKSSPLPSHGSRPPPKSSASASSLVALSTGKDTQPARQLSTPTSFASTPSYAQVSEEARQELRRYEMAFDRTRHQQRHSQ
jgi:hypothetical protein